MNPEIYEKVNKLAIKDFRYKTSKGMYPYLQVLDDILSYTNVSSEVNLGLIDIPLDQVVGTKTAGRTNAFASNFMPLLPKDSEFAAKWCRLYDNHLEEGIRDPVVVYEYMNRFYVMEGNKRISVLKSCDAVTVPAHVTRVVPEPDDSDESIIYFEFMDFYEKTQINYLNFSQPGNYAKITNKIGLEADHVWTELEKEQFHSSYIRFTKAFEKKGGNKLSLTFGDAFLVYLELYGYEELESKSENEIQQEIAKMWNDFVFYPQKPEVKLIMNVEDDAEKKTLVKRILPLNSEPLKVAFIHSKTVETSSWTYGHDLGRGHLEETLEDEVITNSYFQADTPEEEADCFERAIEDGNTVIFSTSPQLLDTSTKYAMKYPKLNILNCSLNTSSNHLRTYYGRLYEAKFLIGAIAGVMSPSDTIEYIADYPIYGMIANINAFALGVQMVNPKIKIYLEWSKLKPELVKNNKEDMSSSFISGRDFIRPEEGTAEFGLYDTRGDELINLAMPVWNWGVFYEKTVKSILNGTWKQETSKGKNESINYWWGMSSGMIDVFCSTHLPSGTVKLVELLKKTICSGDFNPFSGTIYSQDGPIQTDISDNITAEGIITMDWLADNIIGSIPSMDDLVEEAKPIVQVQGVAKAKTTEGES
ncbi:MAG: BMP family ABC transporter substrate-binding protein [Lachnospiraceae bacterium]|nr:BMP family ABC transporter substrate-binding protein [Lachnospiraceae bacterium]